jgi:anti-anti-sigma factor
VTQAQKRAPFIIERIEGNTPGTVIFRFCGPFTAANMYESLPPVALRNMLDFQSTPDEKLPVLNILDLTGVPYMDSSGLGIVVSHTVHCRNRGVRFLLAGASPRTLELLRITRLDGVIPMAATVEDA